ncbi:MAG: GNAT family N-acetyltransferase [Solirubrobacteraceae bacterium]
MDPGYDVLCTERLALRRITAADLAAVVAISIDPRTNEHRPGGTPTRAHSEAICGRFMRDWDRYGIGYWVVQYRAETVGIAGVMPVQLRGHDYWNLYYRFSPAVWGQGVASEATRAAISAATRHTPSRPVIARTRPSNEAAIQLALAVGMERRRELDTGGLIAYVTGPSA